jgi:hypothetical protein
MITITITPRDRENLYGLLIKKEVGLRQSNKGTLHRASSKKKNQEKWVHSQFNGWINLQKCLGGVTVAIVQSKSADSEWQLLSSFVGFLNRHFREEIASINLSYGRENK